MNKIILNAREIQKIYDLFNKMTDSKDFETIELEQSEQIEELTGRKVTV